MISPSSISAKARESFFGEVGVSHRFVVEMDRGHFSKDLGTWSKVSGLTVNWAKVEHRRGDSNEIWVGRSKASYQPIKLSRAACSASKIVQQWLVETSRTPKPLSGTIKMVDFMGMTVIEWKLKQFFPIGWSIDALDAGGSRPVMETLDLVHTGFLDDEHKYGLPTA